jgi:hypothetical protein
MIARIALISLSLALPAPTFAATIDATITGSVQMGSFGAPADNFDSFTKSAVGFSGLESEGFDNAAAVGFFGSGSATSEYQVDGTRGQLRFGLRSEVNPLLDGTRGSAAADAYVQLRETFQITGSGLVTVGMSVSALWSAPSYFLTACVTSSFGSGQAACLTRETTQGTSGGLFGELLELSFAVPDGTDLPAEFTWWLQGGVNVGGRPGPKEEAFLNAMNTANIFVTTSGEVSVTPSTQGFLSDPAFDDDDVAPIPLPATGFMLAFAVGGLFSVVRRRRSAA